MFPSLSPIGNHLWQSTVFAAVALLLAFAMRKNRAQLRYWIWLAASIKFLVPFSLLVTVGSLIEWPRAQVIAPIVSITVEQIGQPFALAMPVSSSSAAQPVFPKFVLVLLALWACGFLIVVTRWALRWRRIQAATRSASPINMSAPLRIMTAPTIMEPGVFGIFRPVLLLPQGIGDRLNAAQLRAILAHEMCHIRRRDNLAAALHMLVEAVFWFHPLVWWIGSRLIEERERACDEEVLRLGNEPQTYAEGILNVCKFYLESPLACAPGVTGADLKKRIEAIMTNRRSHQLSAARKAVLAIAGMAVIVGPVLFGIVRAQSKPEVLSFEVASIKPADPEARRVGLGLAPGGGVNATNVTVDQVIGFAYNIPMGKGSNGRILNGPAWISSTRYDIIAKGPQTEDSSIEFMKLPADQQKIVREEAKKRMQTLLAERFRLAVRLEDRNMPVYVLTVAKNGHKMKVSSIEGEASTLRGERGRMIGENIKMDFFANALEAPLGRPVLDQTGLKGGYDFTLEFSPDQGPIGDKKISPDAVSGPSDPSGSPLFGALQQQLGLKIEAAKGPVPVVIIERVEKPTAN
jgi:uncharacterized protein (TIGR03435 family)